ncbi:MAG: ABC transporter permease [Gemmatimonadota bacterium]|nr:ABC transporter permease [Gemmatimonadota bacterium]
MNRLVATLACDVRLQLRNGFYYAVAFLLVVMLAVITRLPDFAWAPVLPPLVLGNLSLATFFFIAGLVLLEKEEGTLEALIVTPLSPGGYLASKILTLTLLSLAENVLIVLMTAGLAFSAGPLVLGISLASVLYCLAGFIAVVRYDSINELLFPSMVWVTFFSLPFLEYAGIWSSPLVYLHPFQAPLVLLEAAFFPIEPWAWAYGMGYSALWIAIGWVWSVRVFHRFVTAAVGTRS